MGESYSYAMTPITPPLAETSAYNIEKLEVVDPNWKLWRQGVKSRF